MFVLQVQSKFRFPFFLEMQWYVLRRYVEILQNTTTTKTTTTHSCDANASDTRGNLFDVLKKELSNSSPDSDEVTSAHASHLSPREWSGLRALVDFLSGLPEGKQGVPSDIENSEELLSSARVRNVT